MLARHGLSRYYPRQRCVGRNVKTQHSIVLALLIMMVGVLPPLSVAQPLAKGKSKFLGSCVGSVRPDFSTYWNQVTPENAGKWQSVEGGQDSYNWAPLDAIYQFAINNGYRYKHHALIWGQQYPAWITSLDSAGQRAQVEEWVRLVAEKYPSTSFIDVVNEPFHAPPPYMNALGRTGATGWDWVITAFRWARQYNFPGVKLILNEYNILHDNAATTNLLRLVDTLRVRGLIDAIGIQGHYFEFKGSGYTWPVSTLKANLQRLTATGLPVYISEFDVNEPVDTVQLQNYQIYFPLFWEEPGVKGITLWGYVQGNIWKTDAYLVRTNGSERPALRWLRRYVAIPLPPVLVSPLGTTGEPRDPCLVWCSSSSALSYHLQVSTSSTFASVVVDTTVADTLSQLNPLAANTRFYWHVNASNDSGTSSYSATGSFVTGEQIVAVDEREGIPIGFSLFQNYPNPFNPTTEIRFQISPAHVTGNSEAGEDARSVRLAVYDMLGREVSVLVNERQAPGSHEVKFDASRLAGGVYLYRLTAGQYVESRKMVLLK